MKQVPSLRLIETKRRNKLGKSGLNRAAASEAGSLLPDLKNSMTLLYLALENLRSSLDRPAVCAKKIEELKSLTSRIHALMEKLAETIQ